MLANAAGEGLWGFQWHAVLHSSTLAVLLTTHYAASNVALGVLEGLAASAGVAQLLGLYLFYSRRHQKRHLFIWHYAVVIPLIALTAVVNLSAVGLPVPVRRWVLIGSWGAYMWSINASMAAWTDWLSHVFPVNVRGRAFGVAFGVASLTGMAGMAVTAGLVERYEGSTDIYSTIYAGAAVCALLGMFVLAWVRDEGAELAEESTRQTAVGLLRRFGQSLSDRNFRNFLIGRVLAGLGLVSGALVTAYYESSSGGSLTEGALLWSAMAIPLGTTVGCLWLGRLGDRTGHRLGILVGSAVQIAAMLMALLTSGPVSCVAVRFAIGIVYGCVIVSHGNLIIESCPHEHRIAHVTISTLVLALPLALVPVGAGFLAERLGFGVLFAICLAISVTAFLWMLLRVKEPRTLTVGQED
ncbi:MAG: MFS transporter [Planctomycetota bacterium]|jgi:MFS family permease